ncbi:3-phosphoshikimate 1-carboxyvinyltransferase [Helicobacter cinaedi]|uniref:3-phosphoshikimate 1-carboxyvinyltransferase n=1 Tax=Helicobacter cinaedi TaxID=213 RepID=UPI000CF10D7E|nr:3-phosphoshikimate 1-carboxyvinyltransferase [Helicobacter cinaedi]AWK62040.1 3-phosphoshikimate 1-carboxyvinyltransferase [Helicobacter cinaedi]QOQ96133.1 3-phosphoshikimate 1-carboxyvinyltransferase [Helicobacter cinaedi]BBB20172.1 5-enolpyruvylshikimate-3-phosphate synthase [Helicobacter cinaedi]
MRITKIAAAKRFELEFDSIATDKSISHRGAMFALLANAPCEIKGFLEGEDTLHTLEIAKNLGLVVEKRGDILHLTPPKGGLQEPKQVLDCGNAGTGMRLYVGLLSGVKGHFVLSGDEYLNARPMGRVIEPLSAIGADIRGREQNKYAPLSIQGARLKSFNYQSKIASAQVKSAMILAGLRTEGKCRFYEPLLSRNHTENMLKGMGVKIQGREIQSGTNAVDGYEVEFEGSCKKLESFKLEVPADPSSAFFFAVAACVLESKVLLKNVLLNKTRIEAFKILESMGAKVNYNVRSSLYEEIGDIEVQGGRLQAVQVDKNIAWLIDELPALGVCFALAKGRSEVRNAKELRVKESDRILATITNLRAMGIECEEFEDGFSVNGGELKRARVSSFGDHRIAMSFAIAQLVCGGEIEDSACIDVSFPNFLELLGQITDVENI